MKIKLFAALLLVISAFAVWEFILSDQLEIYRYPTGYSDIIENTAKEFDLPPSLVYAVVLTESSFKSDAVSPANAKGLMQLTEPTYEWVSFLMSETADIDMIFDPETNVRIGCKLLSYLINKYGDIETALAAYNAGVGRVKSWLGDDRYSTDGKTLSYIPFEETREYVTKVTKAWKKYDELYFEGRS